MTSEVFENNSYQNFTTLAFLLITISKIIKVINSFFFREKTGKYAETIHKLSIQLMEVIFESLGLMPNYLKDEMEEGMQVMAVNCYPACPEQELVLGMPPHSDYGFLTIISQNCQGLEVMDKERRWVSVPAVDGVLLVHVGDHLEVMSNGRYKSVVHRATVNAEKRRISIASLHSLAIEKKVRPAPELVDEQHPKAYEDISFKDFLDFLSVNDITKKKRFLETSRKCNQNMAGKE